uniref:Uncharacterized protein n=1 Tax=Arundo donax TaxID=35708 RepID=A0A0A9HJK2_ARUDO
MMTTKTRSSFLLPSTTSPLLPPPPRVLSAGWGRGPSLAHTAVAGPKITATTA